MFVDFHALLYTLTFTDKTNKILIKKSWDDKKKSCTLIKKNIKTFDQKKVWGCSMVFGGSPLNTLELLFGQMFDYFFMKVYEKYVFYNFKIF